MVGPDMNNEAAGDCDSVISNNDRSKNDNNDANVNGAVEAQNHQDHDEMPKLGEGDFNQSPRTESQGQSQSLDGNNITEEVTETPLIENQLNAADDAEQLREGESQHNPRADCGDACPQPGEYHSRASQGQSTSRRRITSNDEPKPNLIVNYLPQSFTDKDFFNLFAPYGGMESIKIMRDSQTGYSFGYGFVNYVDLQDAIDARNDLNGMQLGHKKIKVSFARPPSDDIKDTNLFVTGLPTTIIEEELEAMFSPYGVIVHLRVLRDRHTKVTRGVAFVRFETRGEACNAIMFMNGFIPKGARDPIRVRLAQDHGKQKAAYLAGYQAALQMKGGVQQVPHETQFRHPSESSFTHRPRSTMMSHRRSTSACVGEGIRVVNSTSDPSLYWKGFLQGVQGGRRKLENRRPESSRGHSSTSSNSLY